LITAALRHCPGIGPVRLERLHAAGVHDWSDAVRFPERIPGTWRGAIVAECTRCLAAHAAGDIAYFVQRFAPQDRWRILAEYLPRTTFFDLETEGLEYDAPITVIGCWHRGTLRTFVEHENLDAFLDLLDDVELLASFNGNAFDVPRLLDAFHIPALPCPHVDLRWMCHHRGWKGGLKDISERLGIARPLDLQGVDGAWAIHLWHRWRQRQDVAAREQLLRYCAADAVLLVFLAHHLTAREVSELDQLWSQLPAASAPSLPFTPASLPGPAVPVAAPPHLRRLRALRLRSG
jgi:uncharacterized protein